MLSADEKKVASIYRAALGLAEPAREGQWRMVMVEATGLRSLRDARWTDRLFRLFMAVLERRLEEACEGNLQGLPRQIRTLDYWRGQLPRDGRATKEQWHVMARRYEALAGTDPERFTEPYLRRLAARALHRRDVTETLDNLTAAQASVVLDALGDLLQWAASQRTRSTAA